MCLHHPHICNLFLQYCYSQVQITEQNTEGLSLILYSFFFSKRHSERRIYIIPNWFKSSCSKISVFWNLAKFMWEHLCWSHLLTNLQISRPETSLKRDSGTHIFLRIFCNFSKKLIYRTPLDDCSCWFLLSHQSFVHWLHFVRFFLHFFLLLLIIAITGVYSESA